MDLDSLILDCDRFFMMWIPIAVCYEIRDAGDCYLCIAVKYYNPRNWQISDCFSFVRDLHDIGCFVKVIDGCQQLDKETRYVDSNTTGTLLKNFLNVCLPESQFLDEMLSEFSLFWNFLNLSLNTTSYLHWLVSVSCYHYVTQYILGQGT